MHPKQNSGSVDHVKQAFHFIAPGSPERGTDQLKPIAIHQVKMVQQMFSVVELGEIHFRKYINQCRQGFDKPIIAARMYLVIGVGHVMGPHDLQNAKLRVLRNVNHRLIF